jgi:anti-sigma B factor antagonist
MSTADVGNQAASFSLTEAPLEGGGVVLTIRGELDMATVPALRRRLTAITEATARIVLDLTGVSFMDSTALAVFVRAKARLGNDARIVLVVAPDSYARLILDVVGLLGVLDVVETLDEAVQHVA